MILRDEVLEIRNVEGRLHIARKRRFHDEWDPKVEAYDPYGQGESDSNFTEVDAKGIDVT